MLKKSARRLYLPRLGNGDCRNGHRPRRQQQQAESPARKPRQLWDDDRMGRCPRCTTAPRLYRRILTSLNTKSPKNVSLDQKKIRILWYRQHKNYESSTTPSVDHIKIKKLAGVIKNQMLLCLFTHLETETGEFTAFCFIIFSLPRNSVRKILFSLFQQFCIKIPNYTTPCWKVFPKNFCL